MTGDDADHIVVMGNNKITEGIVSVTVHVTIPRPNRYVFGVMSELPQNFNKAFSYRNGPPGFGLRDYADQTNELGIYYSDQLMATSTSGFTTGDLVCITSPISMFICDAFRLQ